MAGLGKIADKVQHKLEEEVKKEEKKEEKKNDLGGFVGLFWILSGTLHCIFAGLTSAFFGEETCRWIDNWFLPSFFEGTAIIQLLRVGQFFLRLLVIAGSSSVVFLFVFICLLLPIGFILFYAWSNPTPSVNELFVIRPASVMLFVYGALVGLFLISVSFRAIEYDKVLQFDFFGLVACGAIGGFLIHVEEEKEKREKELKQKEKEKTVGGKVMGKLKNIKIGTSQVGNKKSDISLGDAFSFVRNVNKKSDELTTWKEGGKEEAPLLRFLRFLAGFAFAFLMHGVCAFLACTLFIPLILPIFLGKQPFVVAYLFYGARVALEL